jgi:hypothetical protein
MNLDLLKVHSLHCHTITLSQISHCHKTSHPSRCNLMATVSIIRAHETVSPFAANAEVAVSGSPSRSQRRPPQLPRRNAKQQSRHSWTDEELNLLSNLRYLRRWRFKQIQKSCFPSLSPSALLGAYWRLSSEDRIRRASRVIVPITAPRNATKGSRSTPKAQPACPSLEQGPSHYNHSISGTFSQTGNNVEASILSSPNPAAGDEPLIPNNSNASRYKLRPNRPSTFPQRKPRYLVDRRRFPHFSKSYRRSLNLHRYPDKDYTPSSRTPTPNSSDRSLSIVSSLPSVASSLRLFGLEARSLHLSDRDSVTSSLPNDISNPEFFSSEERPFPT